MSHSRPPGLNSDTFKLEAASSDQLILLQLKKRQIEESEDSSTESSKKQKGSPEDSQQPSLASSSSTFLPPKRSNTEKAKLAHGFGSQLFLEETYELLSHTTSIIPQAKFCCLGASNREMIQFNLQEKELKDYFARFVCAFAKVEEMQEPFNSQQLTQPQENDFSERESAAYLEGKPPLLQDPCDVGLLQKLVSLVRMTLPPPSDEQELQELLSLKNKDQPKVLGKLVKAPLEWFIEFNKGYCRHQALLISFCLVTWIEAYAKQNDSTFADSQCRVYRYRSQLHTPGKKPVSHAALVYEASNGQRYLLDAGSRGFQQEGLVLCLSDKEELEKAKSVDLYSAFDGAVFFDEINRVYDQLKGDKEIVSSLGLSNT